MTGELTLTGRIYPIGGVREKLVAAKRSGLHTVLLPMANERDYDELPALVKDGISVVFVSKLDEVLAESGLIGGRESAAQAQRRSARSERGADAPLRAGVDALQASITHASGVSASGGASGVDLDLVGAVADEDHVVHLAAGLVLVVDVVPLERAQLDLVDMRRGDLGEGAVRQGLELLEAVGGLLQQRDDADLEMLGGHDGLLAAVGSRPQRGGAPAWTLSSQAGGLGGGEAGDPP